LITQVANYFLEDRKSQNQLELRQQELNHKKHHEVFSERRRAYASYLKELDVYNSNTPSQISDLVIALYSATLVSSDHTKIQINTVFEILRQKSMGGKMDNDEFRNEKGTLIECMRRDLQ